MTKADLERENEDLRAALLCVKDIAEDAVDYEDEDDQEEDE